MDVYRGRLRQLDRRYGVDGGAAGEAGLERLLTPQPAGERHAPAHRGRHHDHGADGDQDVADRVDVPAGDPVRHRPAVDQPRQVRMARDDLVVVEPVYVWPAARER